MPPRTFYAALAATSTACLLVLAPTASGHHGPSTSGGGVTVMSAEGLPMHGFEVAINWQYTDYSPVDATEANDAHAHAAPMHGDEEGDSHYDALDWSLIQELDIAHGVTRRLTMGFNTGAYRGVGLREISGAHGAETAEALGDVSGMTDSWLSAKYSFLYGGQHAALLAGIKFPTGRTDVIPQQGQGAEPLELSVQPGTGTFDGRIGAAYSRWLGGHISTDASAQYTLRTTHNDQKVGDRIDGGVAINAWPSSNRAHYPNLGFVAEVAVTHLRPNEERDEIVANTGGTSLYASLGARLALSEHVTIAPSLQIPVTESLTGTQQSTSFKAVVSLNVAPGH